MGDPDNEMLSDYDLSAWGVPPPRAGLADAVLAKLAQPVAVAAAVDDPVERPPRRWWIGGAIAAVAAAGIAFAAWGSQPAPRHGEGDVVRNPVPPPDREPVVGGSGDSLREQIAENERVIAELQRRIKELENKKVEKTVAPDPVPCDEVACVLNNYEGACCTKFRKGAPRPTPAPASSCDATLVGALMRKADDHLQTGMDAAALASYEAVLRCKYDITVVKKAAMSACRSKNAPKAKLLIDQLPAAQSGGIVQICVRNGIDVTAAPPTTGTLKIQSRPAARIFIDGADTGKTTPMVLQLTPGKHKVTFQLNDNKYTFSTGVRAGEVVSLTKDLE